MHSHLHIQSNLNEEYIKGIHLKANGFRQTVKGTVHPKMKILSVFTHPHVVPTP